MQSGEIQRITTQNARARLLNAPATLNILEWEQTLTDFGGRCAYCLSKPFDVMEHFVPVAQAGTIVTNCLPACQECNQKKRDFTGEKLLQVFGQETIDRLTTYLANRSCIPYEPAGPRKTRDPWSTRSKYAMTEALPDIHSHVEHKSVYHIREFFDNLCITMKDLARNSGVVYATLCRMRDGRIVTREVAEKVLNALSEEYQRDLSLDNVSGIALRQ